LNLHTWPGHSCSAFFLSNQPRPFSQRQGARRFRALDCCDRKANALVATTEGIRSEDLRERFGRVYRLSNTIERLSDNRSGDIAYETRANGPGTSNWSRGRRPSPRLSKVDWHHPAVVRETHLDAESAFLRAEVFIS
jgi:hypothetical protein